jgi:hypothetical protein
MVVMVLVHDSDAFEYLDFILSEFHFLPYSSVFVTHITPSGGTSTKISHLAAFKHGFIRV